MQLPSPLRAFQARFIAFLRYLERYTKTDMVYLFSGLSWSAFGQFFSSGTALLGALAFAHFVSKDTYGTYKFVLSVAGLLSIATLQGMPTAVTRAVARGFEGTLPLATRVRIRYALFGTLAGILVSCYYFFFVHNSLLGFAILIAALLLPFFETFLTFDGYLQGRREFGKDTRYFVVIQVCLYLLLILAIIGTKNLLAIVLAYFGGYALLRYLAYRRVRKEIAADSPVDPDTVSYGKHLSVMGILGVIASNIDQLLLFHYLGPAQVAIYNFALAVPDQVKGPIGIIGNMITAKFSSQRAEVLRERMMHKVYWLLALNGLLVIAYWIGAPYVYRIFFPAYIDSVFYSQIFSVSILGGAIAPIASYFAATKLIKEQYWTTIVGSLFQIITIIVGGLTAGVMGIVIARVATRFFSSFLSYGIYAFAPRKSAE